MALVAAGLVVRSSPLSMFLSGEATPAACGTYIQSRGVKTLVIGVLMEIFMYPFTVPRVEYHLLYLGVDE